MTNTAKGEITFDALDKERTIALTTNVQCAMEDAFGKGFAAIMLDAFPALTPADANDPEKVLAAAREMKVGTIRAFLFHMLRGTEPNIDLNEVGEIMDELGQDKAMELIGQAMSAGTPDRVATEGKAKPKGTPKS